MRKVQLSAVRPFGAGAPRPARKPAELPFEQPTRIDMMINMQTAKALGLKIPHSVPIRAERVIK